ncbi:hypothetical protein [Streptomyces collinus]|uniref:beta-xylosidase family glycoside hydrolase n=1 Tax=Streptomyces collinus TaxID=42684 RepID=UPI0036E4E633
MLDPGSLRGGLSVRLDEAHHYDLEAADGTASVLARIGPVRQRLAAHSVPPGPVTLAVDMRADRGSRPSAGPDGCHLSTEVAGGFTGRVLGMYVTRGRAAFDWFDHEPRAGARDLDAPHAPS